MWMLRTDSTPNDLQHDRPGSRPWQRITSRGDRRRGEGDPRPDPTMTRTPQCAGDQQQPGKRGGFRDRQAHPGLHLHVVLTNRAMRDGGRRREHQQHHRRQRTTARPAKKAIESDHEKWMRSGKARDAGSFALLLMGPAHADPRIPSQGRVFVSSASTQCER